NAILIQVNDRTTGTNVENDYFTVPIPSFTNEWTALIQAGATATIQSPGLTTTWGPLSDYPWGVANDGVMVMTHVADSSATNYEYTIWIRGLIDQTRGFMVQNTNSFGTFSPMYTLNFD